MGAWTNKVCVITDAVSAVGDVYKRQSYEMLKLLKGEEYNDEPVLVSPGACTKENVYEWYPKLKK